MAGFWAWCAAICAALASYLHMVGNERIAARRLRELDGLARSQIALAGRGNALQRRLLEVCPGWEPSPTLLLQLLEAAIAQGVAIPRGIGMHWRMLRRRMRAGAGACLRRTAARCVLG